MIDPVDEIDAATNAAIALVNQRVPDIIRQHMGRDMPFSEVLALSAHRDGHKAAGHTRSAIGAAVQIETERQLKIIRGQS